MDASSADEGMCRHQLTTRLHALVTVLQLHSCLYMSMVTHRVYVRISFCPVQSLSFMQFSLWSSLCRRHQLSTTQLGSGPVPALLIYERGVRCLGVAAPNLHVLAFCNWI